MRSKQRERGQAFTLSALLSIPSSRTSETSPADGHQEKRGTGTKHSKRPQTARPNKGTPPSRPHTSQESKREKTKQKERKERKKERTCTSTLHSDGRTHLHSRLRMNLLGLNGRREEGVD